MTRSKLSKFIFVTGLVGLFFSIIFVILGNLLTSIVSFVFSMIFFMVYFYVRLFEFFIEVEQRADKLPYAEMEKIFTDWIKGINRKKQTKPSKRDTNSK